jgi:hypothetical protein
MVALMPDAEHLWRLVMQRVAEEKPHLESYLRSGRPIAGGQSEVAVEYAQQDAWAADLASRDDNQAYVGRILRELVGRDIAFRIRRTADVPGHGASGQRASSERTETPAPAGRPPGDRGTASRQSALSEVMANPVVKDALTIFGGEVMEVRDLGKRGDRREDDT